jgi:hypothetical protein
LNARINNPGGCGRIRTFNAPGNSGVTARQGKPVAPTHPALGGDDPIRTDGAFRGHAALAVRRLSPLGHVSINLLVGMERFELSCAKALVSKTSVSPISTTSPRLTNMYKPRHTSGDQVSKCKPVDESWWAPRDSNPEDVTALEAAASTCFARSPQRKSPSIARGAFAVLRNFA